ncbi:MAG: DUF4287 domain-containing protein [Candidatus Nanopelagicaceae bacterium]
MAIDKSKRENYFPAIEKKYGEPMSYWFAAMKKLSGKKYPEQMAFLQDNYGFTRAHANAVVMFSRGSTSSRRYESPKDYFAKLEKEKAKTMRKIFSVIQKKYPKLELVISWNQPMLKNGEKYIFGCSASKNHLTIAPWDPKVLKKVAPMLEGYVVNKKTVRVPSDWTVDAKLLIAMVRENLKS